jgi:hypothetical protein
MVESKHYVIMAKMLLEIGIRENAKDKWLMFYSLR